MFRGLHEYTIDQKGRVSVPVKFRDALVAGAASEEALTIVVTTALDPCLVAYSLEEWRAFEDKLAALPQFDPNVLKMKRIYVAAATECSVDKLGRIALPQELRDYAALDKDVVFAGMVKTFEIWSKDRWTQNREGARAQAADVARALAALGL
jgi:MraZ protein